MDDLASDDFDRLRAGLVKGRGPVSLRNDVRHVRMVFKFAYDAHLIERPVRFGPHFKIPTKAVLRRERQKNGKRMFEAAEIRTILDAATQPLRAMVLLAANGGLGNTDVSSLPISAIDFDTGWLDYPRPKTAVERRIPLWTETLDAVKEAIDKRPKAKDASDDGLVFLTIFGQRFVRTGKNRNPIDQVANQFAKLLKRLDLKRPGINFYALRHGFETVAGESRDQISVNMIMGHADQTMADNYREGVSDERLQAVVETVRQWLWPDDGPVEA